MRGRGAVKRPPNQTVERERLAAQARVARMTGDYKTELRLYTDALALATTDTQRDTYNFYINRARSRTGQGGGRGHRKLQPGDRSPC